MKTYQTIVRTSRSILYRTAIRPSSNATRSSANGRITPTRARQPLLRPFSSTSRIHAGLMPDSEDPKEPTSHNEHHGKEPAQLGDSEYHEIADQYLNSLQLAAEEVSEDSAKQMEVDYSVRRPSSHSS